MELAVRENMLREYKKLRVQAEKDVCFDNTEKKVLAKAIELGVLYENAVAKVDEKKVKKFAWFGTELTAKKDGLLDIYFSYMAGNITRTYGMIDRHLNK